MGSFLIDPSGIGPNRAKSQPLLKSLRELIMSLPDVESVAPTVVVKATAQKITIQEVIFIFLSFQ
jgi:hypothetical protein